MGRKAKPDLGRRLTIYSGSDRGFDNGSRLISLTSKSTLHGSSDRGLGLAGAGAALASVVFAFVMMNGDLSRPSFIGGAEYLLLFTRPLQSADTSNPRVAPAYRDRGIDYSATGSIGTAVKSKMTDGLNHSSAPSDNALAAPQASPPSLKDYKLTSVSGGVASIKSPQGAFVVETGSLMPNGDLVVSIDRRGGRWVVVTSSGLIQSQ